MPKIVVEGAAYADGKPGTTELNISGGKTKVLMSNPVRQANVTLTAVGTAAVLIKRTKPDGTVVASTVPMVDEGDGMNFVYSYSPNAIYEVNATQPISYGRFEE